MRMLPRKRLIALVIVVDLCLVLMFLKAAHGQVPIEFFPSTYWSCQKPDTSEIEQIIRQQLSLDDDSPYSMAKVKILYAPDGMVYRLIVHLLDKELYLFETARIDLGSDLTVKDFEFGYKVQPEDLLQDPQVDYSAVCPNRSVSVVSTWITEFSTSVAALKEDTEVAEEIAQVYKKWLFSNNLVSLGRLDMAILLL